MVKSISRKIVLDTPSNYIENLDTLHDLNKSRLSRESRERINDGNEF